jgi:hypothetical protein
MEEHGKFLPSLWRASALSTAYYRERALVCLMHVRALSMTCLCLCVREKERERALGMSIAKVIALSTACLFVCAGEREREQSTGCESESTEYDLPVCVCERERA